MPVATDIPSVDLKPNLLFETCDRCRVQAHVMVNREEAVGPLTFCKHHFEKFELALIEWAVLADSRPELEASEASKRRGNV